MRDDERTEPTDDREARPSTIESLVAECLERSGTLGPSAVDRVCAENPDHADAIRERLAVLARVGLLGNDLQSERRIGPYELLRHLGSGGMAVVFQARVVGGSEVVALKTADPRLPWNDRLRERFRREIEAARRLDHPRIVAIRDVGESDGVPYYTMDHVEGATLGKLLDALRAQPRGAEAPTVAALRAAWRAARFGDAEPRGSWGHTYVEVVCRIVLEIANALEHVHERGIVHRDVKPSNVLVDAHGHGNLFDLGLAHLSDVGRLTQTGDFAGSPHYAAPEQITGSPDELDTRTDVYGLGATLFELIALRPPFEARTTPELLRRVQRVEAPPLRQLASWAPRDLEVICQCCLEKNPDHRYASASELALDLERFLGFEPVRARPVGAVRRLARLGRRNPAPALAILLTALILVATPLALWLHSLEVSGERDRATIAATEARREATENREVSRFLEELILRLEESSDPAHREAADEMLRGALARLDRQADIHPLTRAGLFHTVARVLTGKGRELDAIALLDRSYSIRASELGERHTETAGVLAELAVLHHAIGNTGSARELAQRALDTSPAAAAATRTTASAHEILGRIALEEGDATDALERLERARDEFARIEGAGSTDEARVLRSLGRAHQALERWEPARAAFTRSIEIESDAWEPHLGHLASSVELLAALHDACAEPVEASARWGEVVHLQKKRGRAVAPTTERALGRLVELLEERLAGGDLTVGERLVESCVLLGENRAARGSEGAEAAFQRALALAEDDAGADRDALGRAHLGLGEARFEAGLVGDAFRSLDDALAIAAASGSAESWVARLYRVDLLQSEAAGEVGRVEAGIASSAAWFERRAAESTGRNEALIRELRAHALLLFELGHAARAEPLLVGADELERGAEDPDRARVGLAADDEGAAAYWAAFQEGVTHIQAHRHAEAIRAFERCRAARPREPIAAYNIACVRARMGDADGAFEALDTAIELGYAYRTAPEEQLRGDTDLAALQDDPRFAVVLERVRSLADAAAAYASEPLTHVPDGVLASDVPPPLLVVLHAEGETKRSVLEGPWRELADALGMVLLAPSGRFPVGTDPEDGVRWVDDLERYRARTWYFEKPARDAIAAFRRNERVDPDRIYVAGEGLGGSLAFHVAITSPELVRGVLLVDAAVPLDLAAELGPSLGSLGLRVALLANPDWRPRGVPAGVAMPDYLTQTLRQLGDWGLPATLATEAGRTPEALLPLLTEGLLFLDTGRLPRR